MALVKLAAKLPDDTDINGLEHHAGDFRKHPHQQWVAVVYLGVQKITHDYEKNELAPTLMVEAVEILGEHHDVPDAVRHAYQAARDRRTNREPLFDDTDHHDGDDDGTTVTVTSDLEARFVAAIEAPGVVDAEIIDDETGEVLEGGDEQ